MTVCTAYHLESVSIQAMLFHLDILHKACPAYLYAPFVNPPQQTCFLFIICLSYTATNSKGISIYPWYAKILDFAILFIHCFVVTVYGFSGCLKKYCISCLCLQFSHCFHLYFNFWISFVHIVFE